MHRHLLYILTLCWLMPAVWPLAGQAQERITVKGRVTDEHTEEPLAYANVNVQGTTTGRATDIDGYYAFKVPADADTLIASVIGYDKQKKPIGRQPVQVINFEMTRSDFTLEEVVVRPGPNPAHLLLEKIVANKPDNNRENLDAYQYEVYNKLELDIDNIHKAEFTKKKFFEPFQFILDNIDTISDEKPFLPVFLTESLSDYYYRKKPKAQKEVFKATRLSGIKRATVTEFLGSMYQDINIYSDFVPLLGKSFVSPISSKGLNYYEYILADTAVFNGYTCYKVNFKPKRKQQNTFFGYFWVADSVYALKEVSMRMSKDVNINFIQRLSIFQEFIPVKDSGASYQHTTGLDTGKVWMLHRDKLIIDFIATQKALNIPGQKAEESLGLIGRKTTSYADIIVNDPEIDRHFDKAEEVVVEDDVYDKDEDFWNTVRHDTLSKNEQSIYKMVDSLKNIPIFKTYVDVVTMIVTGYQEIGKVDIGPYFSLLSSTQVEGTRMRFGARTNNTFSERLMLKGYIAYGFRDRNYKYGLGAEYILSRDPWQKAGVSYKNDLNLESDNFDELDQDNVFALALLKQDIQQMLVMEEIHRIYYERDIFQGLSSRLSLQHKRMEPQFNFSYAYENNNANNPGRPRNGNGSQDPLPSMRDFIITAEASLNMRFAHKEKFVKGGFNRLSLGTRYPVLEFNYTMGIPEAFGSQFQYHKMQVQVFDDIKIKPKGRVSYRVFAGRIFGEIPYPLLHIFNGNPFHYYNKYAFNNMNDFEFASDMYAGAFLTHRFGGMLLDRIPLLRRLKWRTLLTGRSAWGTIRAVNEHADIRSPYPIPYVEGGFGIENIFKLIRIDAIWRFTHRDTDFPTFGVYGSLQLQF